MEYLTFGRSLERCRTHFLPRLADRRSALVLGDGDGRFLAALLAANPKLVADAVDSSAAMLRLLKSRANAGLRLRTHHTSALNYSPDRRYDLIVTHFFLDCLTQFEVDTLCARLVPYLRPHTLWLVSDFQIPTGPMRRPARAIVRLLYLGFRILTGLRTTALPDHATALSGAGLSCIAEHRSLAGLLITQLWEYTPAMLPPQKPKATPIADPVPDPEPASPSLPEPDPGVFHHDVDAPKPAKSAASE
jgi:SAM-dependent methyltransferase